MIRRCKGCKRLFAPLTRGQVYHSLRCGNAARQRRRYERAKKALARMEHGS